MSRLQSLVPRLPREVWFLELGVVVNAVGTGMVLPFQVIYLHLVRGFSLPLSGAITATWAFTALVAGFFGGALADRIGPRSTATVAMLTIGAGYGSFAFVERPWQGFACTVVAGMGSGVAAPSLAGLVAVAAGRESRHIAYSVQFAATNLGFAVGAALAGALANVHSLRSFQAIFLLDLVSCVSFAVVLLRLPSGRAARIEPGRERGSYRRLLAYRSVLALAGLTAVLGAAGLAVYEVGLPIFAVQTAHLGTGIVGIFFLANSVAIVLTQLPIAAALRGRRRLHGLALGALLWALAWGLVELAGLAPRSAAPACICAALLFAGGESLVVGIQSNLVIDLVPEEIRGRALAVVVNSFGVGLTLGPPLVGFVLGRAPLVLWPAAGGILLCAALAFVALERVVPVSARRIPRESTPEAPEVSPRLVALEA